MNSAGKLITIKIVHTLIWLLFNLVFFYMVYAVIINKIDKYVWICIGLFAAEIMVLIFFKNVCPLTIIARQHSNSTNYNFDIYLPNWLAKNNKLIYSVLLFIFMCLLSYRLLTNPS